MLIFDGDCPAASSLLDERNRDLTLSLDELRAQMRVANPESIFVPYACLPEMRRGGIACVLMKIVARRVWPEASSKGFMEPSQCTRSARASWRYTARSSTAAKLPY